MLSTLSASSHLAYPLTVEFRDGPDVALHMSTGSVGVECTDAIAEDWANILDLRAREYPRAMVFLPRLQPGGQSLLPEDVRAYASGAKAGPPWEGDSVEWDWAKAISYFADKKLEKLRAGAYSDFPENWLLVHDEWAMHPVTAKEQALAVALLAANSKPLFSGQCFSRIMIEGSAWLTCLTAEASKVTPVVDLWN